jgi:DDE superfamily endonuclease
MPCRDPMRAILKQFCPLFTAPTGKNLITLLRGMPLARGRRTVSAALWQTGHHPDRHLSAFHQVLNRTRWSPLEASRHVLSLILETFVHPMAGADRSAAPGGDGHSAGADGSGYGLRDGFQILPFFIVSGRTPESAGLRHGHPAHTVGRRGADSGMRHHGAPGDDDALCQAARISLRRRVTPPYTGRTRRGTMEPQGDLLQWQSSWAADACATRRDRTRRRLGRR